MKTDTPSIAGLVALALVLALSGGLSAAQHFIIVQPGYPGSTTEAEAFVTDLLAAIGKGGGPGDLQGEYHNDAEEALKAIREKKPQLGIVSLGFYLAHKEDLRLEPLLASRPHERFYLAGKQGAVVPLKDLAGKTVAGTPFQEPEFVSRILFGPEVSKWKVEATRSSTKAIRDASRGKVAAVLLTEREKRALGNLTAGQELEVYHQTDELPTAILVSLGKKEPSSEAAA